MRSTSNFAGVISCGAESPPNVSKNWKLKVTLLLYFKLQLIDDHFVPVMRPEEDNKPLVLVEKPNPHDILCGRGGRTNLHKGNIWFRKLVRSNRALYKTCPKHTKLLVAKAVVKAVQGQNPPGRYLEADRATGGWKEIPYKRALDKTSQALRERDPNPTPENGGISSRAKEAVASALKNDANLEGLTKATLEQAGLLDDLRQSSSLKTEPIKKPPPTKKRGQDPPGRYLEADRATGGWKEILWGGVGVSLSYPNANLEGLTKATLEQAGLLDDFRQSSSLKTEPITKPPPTKKRKEPEQFKKPASQGTPIPTATQPSGNSSMAASGGVEPIMKRQKAEEDETLDPI